MHSCQPHQCNASHYLFVRNGDCIGEIYENETRRSKSWDGALSFLFLLQNQQKFENLTYHVSFEDEGKGIHRRKIQLDQLGRQESILPIFNQTVHYKQTSKYVLEKFIIERIDVEDSLSIDAQNFKALDIEIVTIVQPTKKQMKSKDEISCASKNFDNCLAMFKTDFGYKKFTDSIESYFGFVIAMVSESLLQEKEESRRCTIVSRKGLKSISEYRDPESTRIFLKAVSRVERASDSDVKSCLELFADEYAHGFMNILATSGCYRFYKIVKDFTSNRTKDLWDKYVSMLPHAFSVEKLVVEDLMKIVTESDLDKPDMTLLFSAASILKSQRYMFKKRKEMKEYENLVGIFLEKLKDCQQESCYSAWLSSLENVPVPELISFIEQRLCTKFGYEDALLKIMRSMKSEAWSKKSIHQKLQYIYSNLCPKSQSQSARIIAAQLLLKITPTKDLKDQLFGMIQTMKESTSSGREILASLLSIIKEQATYNPNFKDIMTDLRKKRYYNQFLSIFAHGQSASLQRSVDVFGLFEPFYNLDIEFGGGLLKRAEAQVGLSMSDQVSTIAGLDLFSRGSSTIMNLVGSAQSSSSADDYKLGSSDDEDSNDDQTLTAGLKLKFFDHADKPIIFFNGQTELLGAVWAAGGETVILFNRTFLLNDFRVDLPAGNGFLLNVDLKSALSLKIGGSVEISLWYRNLKAALNSRGNFVSVAHLSVSSGNERLSQLDFDLSSTFESDILTDVDFYASPAKSCFQIAQIPHNVFITPPAPHTPPPLQPNLRTIHVARLAQRSD
uniref:MTP large subunit lipid-binding domain-containing protein n=1 Tax=Romanomermis culicivorax TaxID=13658 RepID=A0A915HUQ7_ROMCU